MKISQLTKIRMVLALAAVLFLVNFAQAAEPRLMAAFFVKGKVGLKWAPEAGVSEYLIFRAGPDGQFKQIGSTGEDRFFDEDVSGGTTYTYKIAIDQGGTQVFSGTKSVTIPGSAGAFKAPNWVGLRLDQDKVFLNWDPVPGAIAYNILRSDVSGSGHAVVGTSQGSRYVDKDGLVKGNTYYYVLSAMNGEFDESPQSEEMSIKYGISLEEQEALAAAQNKIELFPFPMKLKYEITEGRNGNPMNQPSDVFTNSQGMVYVIDVLNANVNCYEPSGKYKFSFGRKIIGQVLDGNFPDGEFLLPFTLFIDAKGEVYVADIDRHDIQVFTSEGKFLRRIQVAMDEGMNALRPNGLHVLADGRLVMTDTGNHRFLVTDKYGKILVASGTRGTEEGQFIFPDELTVDSKGIVSIVDPINCRIQQFDLEGKFLKTFGQIGQSAGTFGRPKGIAIDDQDMIWVSDGMSNMIQRFNHEGVIQSVLGTADDGFSFTTPRGIHFHDGQMFVVQRLANKVAAFSIQP